MDGEVRGCRTTACSGPGPRLTGRLTGDGRSCAAPAADAERRYADVARVRVWGRSMTRGTAPACVIAMLLCASSVACTRSGVAAGLNRDAVSRIKVGMSSADVFRTLGTPLSDRRDPPDETKRRLVYARSAVLSLGDSHLMASGLDCAVLLEEDAVVSAYIIDTKRDLVCRCEPEACQPEWSSPCLTSLPAAPVTRGSP